MNKLLKGFEGGIWEFYHPEWKNLISHESFGRDIRRLLLSTGEKSAIRLKATLVSLNKA